MLKINRKVEYALMALKYMVDKGESKLSSAREVCDRFHTPFDTTAKVMQLLNHKGILQSVKGVKGGYSLARDLQQITYLELCNIIEGPTTLADCMSSERGCELSGSCNIIAPLHHLGQKIMGVLGNLTLAELLQTKTAPEFEIELHRGQNKKLLNTSSACAAHQGARPS